MRVCSQAACADKTWDLCFHGTRWRCPLQQQRRIRRRRGESSPAKDWSCSNALCLCDCSTRQGRKYRRSARLLRLLTASVKQECDCPQYMVGQTLARGPHATRSPALTRCALTRTQRARKLRAYVCRTRIATSPSQRWPLRRLAQH